MRYGRVLGTVFFVLAAAVGALAAFAPVAWPGLELTGSACGGGGEEQVCRELARPLTLVEVGRAAWLWVAGGAACAVIAVTALALRRHSVRLLAATAIFALAVAGLVTTVQVDVLLTADDGSTVGRADEEWGRYLLPALLDFRSDGLRRYEGRRERPGAPPYEREQILESFAVHALAGWKVLRVAVFVLLFASLFEVARASLGRPSLALVIAGTGGAVLWALVEDASVVCEPGGSECYRGLLTMLVLVAAAGAWAAYGIGVALGRLMRPRPLPPRG